ncbi:MAG: hypothetical protein EZS28_034515 [Streblomastix strix]|uniref:Uncharacterized protein n=1 Tax=Streblomastix strix TaxID=222440 RepID=A0A5J4UGY3_9EUKA|nr:MAG: hypothetical protein EZS28_034515 [Streblomastix strix]
MLARIYQLMAFDKLLLIFTLVTFVRPRVFSLSKLSLQGSDTIINDQRTGAQIQIDTNDGVLPWGNSSTDSKLQIFPSGYTSASNFAIYSLKGYPQETCTGPINYYNSSFFELESAAALAYYSQNIYPSGLHIYNCHAKYLKTLTDAQPTGTTQTFYTGCNLNYDSTAILSGIASEDCYGSSGSFTDTCKTQCVNGSTKQTYGSSLRLGQFTRSSGGYSQSEFQEIIARFGPVMAYSERNQRWQIYYGWHSDFSPSLLTFQYMYRVGKANLQLASEFLSPWPLVNQLKFFVQPPADCTSSSVPKFGCKCTSSYQPYGCICPTTPEGLLYISKLRCPCITNDQRGSCKTCTGATSDASDCICPTTPQGLLNVPIDRCYCISGDLRQDCQAEKCRSSQKPPQGCICSGYYAPTGCTCPILGTDMEEGLSTSTCPCIKNDVRSQCQPTACTSSSVPQQGCICSQIASPSACTCPDNPQDLIGVPTARCPCKDENVDPRGLCQTCTGATGQPSDCNCPTTPSGLHNVPKSQCPCITNDQRGSCQLCSYSNDDPECICPTTPDGLQNVPKNKCPCISGDLRSDCQPEKCTSSVKPPQGCICSGYNTPSGCTCPTAGTDMDQRLSTSTCPCIKDDVRSLCKPTDCTTEEYDFPPPQGCFCSQMGSPTGCMCYGLYHPIGCICTTESGALVDTPKEQCECLIDDYRQDCQDVDKDASGSIVVLLSVVATVLVLPVFALFC